MEPTLVGRLLALPANIRLGWKGFTGKNALAYLAPSSVTKKKSFITFPPGLLLQVNGEHEQHTSLLRRG
jgi:hypothetical protein